MGVKEPQPLRSPLFPHGLPHLSGSDLTRVSTANAVYKNIASILELATLNGAYVSVENPARSYVWQTKLMKQLIQRCGLFAVRPSSSACMEGKSSACYTNAPELRHLEATSHENYLCGKEGEVPLSR